jgi:hypothetical protein
MIVFNLSCSHEHKFDGWFRSMTDFERQADAELVECPMCGDTHITKHLSAPRINSGASEIVAAEHRASRGTDAKHAPPLHKDVQQDVMAASTMPRLQEHMLKQFKAFVRANTENVGQAFAETARKMHYGEESFRNIRGRVSAKESIELREEGIETVALPPGIFLDEGVQ